VKKEKGDLVIAYTTCILCSYIHICYIPIHLRIYVLIHVLQLTTKKNGKFIYRWIQNGSTKSRLNFGNKRKATTATRRVNIFKIVIGMYRHFFL